MLLLCFTSQAVPVIYDFSPRTAAPGAPLTITGTNFNDTAANNIVYFGGVKASVISSAINYINVIVPFGAAPGTLMVAVGGKVAYSSQTFLPTFAGNTPLLSSSCFASPVAVSTNNQYSEIKLADMDGDGKLDLVLNDYDTIVVFRNIHVTGNPFTASSFAAPYKSYNYLSGKPMILKDLYGNGKIQVLTMANSGFLEKSNYSTPGTISLGSSLQRYFGNVVEAFDVGYPSGDGKPVCVGYCVNGNFHFLKAVYGSSFSTINLLRTFTPPSYTSPYVHFEDINGDQKEDIIVSQYQTDSTLVYENGLSTTGLTDSAGFTSLSVFRISQFGFNSLFADMDNDQQKDWCLYNKYGTVGTTVSKLSINRTLFFGGGISPGYFEAPVYDTATGGYKAGSPVLADLNGDGKPDFASCFSSPYGSTCINGMRLSTNVINSTGPIASGPFAGANLVTPVVNGNLVYEYIAIGDVNQDRKPDIVTVELTPSLSNVINVRINTIAENKPTVQASALSVSAITNNSVHLSWTNGNGVGRIVIAKATINLTDTPKSYYPYLASGVFGAGTQLAPGTFVVYVGTGNNTNVTALTPGTAYRFAVFEFNGHSAAMNFQIQSPASGGATTLPVTMRSFNGTVVENDVFLKWQTASESNNDHFELERSADGKSWEFIASIKGHGTSAIAHDYDFDDEGVFEPGIYSNLYYLLKQVDYDGKFILIPPIHVIKQKQEPFNFTLAPNPAEGNFVISINSNANNVRMQVQDLQGQVVYERSVDNGEVHVEMPGLQAGVYFVTLFNGSEKVSQKLVMR